MLCACVAVVKVAWEFGKVYLRHLHSSSREWGCVIHAGTIQSVVVHASNYVFVFCGRANAGGVNEMACILRFPDVCVRARVFCC